MFLEKVKHPHSNGGIVKNNPHVMVQYCTLSLECYSSLRTRGSWTFILWQFPGAKHYSESHVIGLPVDLSITHMWRIDIIHLWVSWSSCFLTSDLIMYFYHLPYIHFMGNKLDVFAGNVSNNVMKAKEVDMGIQSNIDGLSCLFFIF